MTPLLYVWKKKASAAAKMEGRQALQRVDICNFNAIRDIFPIGVIILPQQAKFVNNFVKIL